MDMYSLKHPEEFCNTPFTTLEKQWAKKSDSDWQKDGEAFALNLFHKAATQVPAYTKFLKTHKILHETIQSIADFASIPLTDKQNYIYKYPLSELVWDGNIHNNFLINASSGTTGLPQFWPVSIENVTKGAVVKELLYRKCFSMHKRKTLLIICFGMGTWIAGSFTLQTSQLVAKKNYPLTIITPGFNKEETLRILELLSPEFEQTIIAGIPTFVKDLLEEWSLKKDSNKVRHIRLLLAAEGFSEQWRDYMLEKIHSNNLTDIIGIFGSADATLMGFETKSSIDARQVLSQNKNLRSDLFNDEKLPTLTNYIPSFTFFEKIDNQLVLTANRGIPLIRYNIHDYGGVFHATDLIETVKKYGAHISKSDYNLPFVYVFGRGKFTATIYAANIYPENIREVLDDKQVRKDVTGKFLLETKYNKKQDHSLIMRVELQKDVKKSQRLINRITKIFMDKVPAINSEYKRILEEYGLKAKPHVRLYEFCDKKYFPSKIFRKSS